MAEHLGIPAANVAVGPRRSLKGVEAAGHPALSGPEYVTPLGIAITAITQECFHFFGVCVNGKRLKLLNTTHMRLMDVLLMAGYRAAQIIARSGRSLTFTLNGEQKTIRGGLPEHATVTLNGRPANIDTDVRPGDDIQIIPAREGAPAQATARDLLPQDGAAAILINGQPAQPDTPILSGDVVEIYPLGGQLSLEDWHAAVAAAQGDDRPAAPQPQEPPAPMQEPPAPEAQPQDPPAPEPQQAPAQEPAPLPPAPQGPEEGEEAGQDEEGLPPPPPATLALTLNGKAVSLPLSYDEAGEPQEYFMMHLLDRAGIDPANPEGQLVIECDGEAVGFTHPIRQGAKVFIGWRK